MLLDPDTEFPRLCAVLGQPELAANPLFATNAARADNAEALFAILQGQFESRALDEWRGLFRGADIKWAPLPTLDEVVDDPQMRAAGAFVDMDGPDRLTTIDSPIFSSASEKRRPAAPPELGAHTGQVLDQLGYESGEIRALAEAGAVTLGG